jgi:cohesin loading factor subunit SCC2
LTAVIWGQELAHALRQCQNILGDVGDEDDGGREKKVYTFGVRLKRALTEVWKDAPTDVFDTP